MLCESREVRNLEPRIAVFGLRSRILLWRLRTTYHAWDHLRKEMQIHPQSLFSWVPPVSRQRRVRVREVQLRLPVKLKGRGKIQEQLISKAVTSVLMSPANRRAKARQTDFRFMPPVRAGATKERESQSMIMAKVSKVMTAGPMMTCSCG